MTRAKSTYLALVAVLLSPMAANAVPIIDIDNDNTGSDSGTFVASDQQLAQVFEVGLDGILTLVDVQVYRRGLGAGDLVFDLLPVLGGVPVADLSLSLATLTIDAGEVSLTREDFLGIDLSAFGIGVSVGDLFAVSLRGTAPLGNLIDAYLWTSERPRDYEQGYLRNNDTEGWRVSFDTDFGIRTVVDTASVQVPEPSTLALLGIGLLGMGLSRRRKA